MREEARETRPVPEQNVAFNWERAGHRRWSSEFIGHSEALRDVFQLIARVAPSDSTVLLMGESGVGKELVARAIHRVSSRSRQPFVVIDCSALHEDLLQSVLFGHEKGAFTGAHALKRGLFEMADGATIFLDEIGELALPLQTKLLRVIESGSFRPLGGLRDIVVDARIIAATNRDLPGMVKDGRFREDLFYRINVVSIVLPPLRKRREDIPVLARHFARRFSRAHPVEFTQEAMDVLTGYSWPGNVRELQNVVERSVTLCDGRHVDVQDLPGSLQATAPFVEATKGGGHLTLKEVERRYIKMLLRQMGSHRGHLAQALGISQRSLYRKLKEYGLS